ncbi:flavodoxin [Fructilactobacillus lindneri]|uniref:Modulator of drug activity B n=2 Tax=Fructilactobacillus lindneri TaxID=53444 RepID=A0A0R2JUJ9_9LACO|nr:NAD(P)H-dependent oxidoreductase [Fructilactobacillus lindneri]ANZ57858.1 flavodoxin [Fructilactobacillus lindneri]ANZ59127.1 flavodoxin [Fructilactobacillus lindneri]KRN78684.1 modulator of drug activity B [Fructilactobacillus lindneri DSM 20690 = JCM 11027]POG98179.1 flavodoxin [Fructilactobacillus lindneri]POH01705.1 flavodoxin [Fructilactobacillus lindneri]
MKVLIINGHEKAPSNKGELNQSLVGVMVKKLRNANDEVQLSSVEDYDTITEINKFLWADLIIFQFPVYWFNVPGKLKLYLDNVLQHGIFYAGASEYGRGGLLQGKKFLFSTTWNAPITAFNDPTKFFAGASVDDVFQPLYYAMEYCGLQPLTKKSISFHNVISHPEYQAYKKQLEQFMDDYVLNQ